MDRLKFKAIVAPCKYIIRNKGFLNIKKYQEV